MANLSFVPAQWLRKFVVKDGEDVSDMMWGKPETDLEWIWTRSCPIDLEKRWPQHCCCLLPGHVSVSAGGTQDELSACCRHHMPCRCSHVPAGTWLCSQPRAAVFLHLPQPSSAGPTADSSAVEVQTEHKLSGSLGILKKKGNFFILEMKNVMSAMSSHCMSPEMASSLC